MTTLRVVRDGEPKPLRLSPAQQKLVLDVVGLVKSLVSELCPGLQPVDRDDAMGWGTVGASRAALRFDPTRGYRFTTYAYPYIAGEIKDWMIREGRIQAFRKTVSLQGRALLAEWVAEDATDNESKTSDELLFQCAERLLAAMLAGVSATPLDPEASAVDHDMQHHTVMAVRAAFASMPEAERKVYRKRYGPEGMTMEQIGDALGVSETTARQYHQRLLDRIAASLYAYGVTEMPRGRPPFEIDPNEGAVVRSIDHEDDV